MVALIISRRKYKMLNKKLTDAEISKLEAWADMRKDLQSLSKEDKTILNQIDAFRKNKWEGMRLTAKDAATQQAKGNLEELKRKKV